MMTGPICRAFSVPMPEATQVFFVVLPHFFVASSDRK